MAQLDYTRRLERLLEISRKMNASLELEPISRAIVEAAAELIHCQDCSILTYDETNNSLKFIAGSWFQYTMLKQLEVPLQDSIAGWVYTHAQPIVVQDASQADKIYRGVDSALNYETRTLLAVPMMFNGQAVGVIEAVNKEDGSQYTDDDRDILETLASIAAVALQNFRLLEHSQKAYEQIVELDRMKTDFVAVASHELRTPLGLILGHATFLRETLDAENAAQMDIIVKNAMRLKEIVEDLSSMDNFATGMARLHLQPVQVDRLVQDVTLSFQEPARQKDITLMVEVSRAAFTMNLDINKFSIILTNLLKNAINFTNTGGHVLVRAEQQDNELRLTVTDDGAGMSEKELKHIFDRFYQVESHLTRRVRGMGLGLSIAKELAEMHSGKIIADSVEGQGSRFTILIPIRDTIEKNASEGESADLLS